MDLFPQESGAYGHFNQLFEDAFDTCMEADIQGSKVFTQSQTAFFISCMPQLKHFLHSGFGVRQACDLLYFAKKYRDRCGLS